MRHIGESPPRPDGWDKVSGASRFADDSRPEGMWIGATVRSPHARARIDALRWSPDRAPAGAVCVTAADIPGGNGVLLLNDDWPVLADKEVRHVGEPVALVAAPDRAGARLAAAAVEVDYTPLPPVLDLEEAAEQPLLSELLLVSGDVEAGLAGAARMVEGTYRTGHQEHIYIECQGMTAWYQGEDLIVEGSMQCPYYVERALEHALGLPGERISVRSSAVGGGFGGKEDYPSMIAVHAALLAGASGGPVRLVYDRQEDIVGTTKRHPALVRYRSGFDPDGNLLAADVDLILDGGAYTTLTPVVLSRAVLHSTGPYRCPSVRIRGRAVRTNTATNGAFRGFGAPQAQFAAERQMDRAARALGLDPLEIRLRNALRPGDRLATGQVLDESTAALECLERVARETDFRARWRQSEKARAGAADGEPLPGVGLSLYFHGAGFTGTGEKKMRSPVTGRLREDGRLEILTSMVDMGQGCAAVFLQIACEAGGLSEDDLVFAAPDTARVPDSGPTVASRTTMVVGGTLARVTSELVRRVVEWRRSIAGDDPGLRVEEGRILGGDGREESFQEAGRRYHREVGPLEVTLRHEPPAWQEFDESTYQGSAYPTYGWGADVAEVEIDPDTLEVTPRRVTAVCEVGRVLHPRLCAGQVEGGTLQGVGWALMEEVRLDEGRYLNDRLATYIIPTIRDTPEIRVHLLEKPWKGGPFGAKGVGELPMDGAAPAVAAAIENALGLQVDEIPATPERLLAAGGGRGGDASAAEEVR